MANSQQLKQMFASYQQGDDAGFREVASEVIVSERQKHHGLLADELQRILDAPPTGGERPKQISSLRPLPTSRDDAPLIETFTAQRQLDGQTLRADVRTTLDQIVEEQRRGDVLRAHGLQPSRKLLFVGPPGTGKTSTAEAVAGELGVPFARVQVPAVVSSLLGETARNVSAVFDFCRREHWVLLFDEFDALGKERADEAEHGELKRVVTVFLQLLDEFSGPGIVIAATNHPLMLDEAVWRRFDEVVGFPLPNQKELEKLVRRLFKRVRLSVSVVDVARRLKGMSHAEAEMTVRTAMKLSVLRDGDAVTTADLDAAVRRQETRRATIHNSLASPIGPRGSKTSR
ncbi:MAG: ATP-binding protein [Actinomycetota bacterium]|nr:ATP-binding protein [Actinomycetota bacterium]